MIDKQLIGLIGKDKRYVIYSVLLNVFSMLVNTLITAGICYIIYLLYSGVKDITYLYPALVIVVGAVARYILMRLSGECTSRLGGSVKRSLRDKTYDKIMRLGVRSSGDMSVAGLTQVSLEGVEQLDTYYSQYLPQFFYSMIAPLLLFVICAPIEWKTALVLLACVPLIPLSIVAVSKYAKKIFAKYWGRYTSMGDSFLDSVQGLKELKIFGADGARHKQMNESSEEFRRITMKALVMQLMSTTIMDLVAYGGAGAGIALAIWAGVDGGLEPAKVLFLTLVAVEFFLPLRSLGSAFHVAMNGASAGRKILELLALPEPEWGDKKVSSSALEIKDVTFSYGGGKEVLKGVNMSFPENSLTAIVGESGSGKSTCVSLLMGAIRANSGEVTVGGTPIGELDRADYYSHLGIVSYNTYIFNDSVRNNFLMYSPRATDGQMYEALKEVNLDKFIREEGGLDKVISEDGVNISGGQRQRLALAVNLLADKSVYIFDEATSNIDGESEALIMDGVRKLSRRAAVVLISHRMANVTCADNIYVLDGGKVAESGTHEELMGKGGVYAGLYKTQKALEEGGEGEI